MNTRLEKVSEILEEKNLDAILVSNWENIIYLSGFATLSPREREAWLVISKRQAILVTDGRYIEIAKKLKSGFKIIELKLGKSFNKDILPKILKQMKVKNLGFESKDLKFYEYQNLKKILKIKLMPLLDTVEDLRKIKGPEEIKKIKKACQIADKAFEELLKIIKPGMREKEVALKLESLMCEKGADGPAFDFIIASGPNSAIPHHRTSNRKIKKGEILLLDFGAKYQNYLSDTTRCLVLNGVSSKQKNIFNLVMKTQEKVLKKIKSGMTGKEVDRIAREEIKKAGFIPYSHGLGHGVGLEIHEAPRLSLKSQDTLKEGMVFSVEPGIYIPGWAGIRIEDLVVLTEKGVKILTHAPNH